MGKQKDSPLEFMVRGIKFSTDKCETDLRTVTDFLDMHFKGLNANQLKEYTQAVDAIRAYQKALVNYFEGEYLKNCSGDKEK